MGRRLAITGMTCANCVRHVERALRGVPGVQEATVNLATESADVRGDADLDKLRAAVAKAGYGIESAEQPLDAAAQRWRQFVFAAAFTAPLFVYTMAWLPLGGAAAPWDAWLALALATPVQVVAGAPYYQGAWKALRNRDATMDTLVAVGTTAAFGLSLWNLLQGHGIHGTYFETAAVIITLITLGKFFEARAKRSSQEAVRSLLELGATTARRITDDGTEEVEVHQVQVGDRLRVRPGEKVPLDGTVVDGSAHVDESMVTGEPDAVRKQAGDAVIGATLVSGGSLDVQVTRVGDDTLLAQIVRLVEEANTRKAPLQRIADRVSRFFVPIILVIAAGAGLAWWLVGATGTFALLVAVSVLVIACPCAMGLATPTAIMMGTGLGAKRGILIKGGEALERVRDVDTVVLDKTGTVTEGKPRVTDVASHGGLDPDFALALAAAVEEHSEHPLARAVVAEAKRRGIQAPVARDFQVHEGRGASATVDGADVHVGSGRWMQEQGIDAPEATILVAIDGVLELAIQVEDPVRKSTARAVQRLHDAGKHVVMLTGDTEANARRVADKVGIDDVIAQVLPADKAEHISRLQQGGAVVAMVGDGINDAPALAQADVGIAMGTGTDVAKETGDVVLVQGDLDHAVDAMELSTYTVRKIRQNLGWAFGYNVALVPVAAGALYASFGILINPMFAALAMAFSSVSVVGNSLVMRSWSPSGDRGR